MILKGIEQLKRYREAQQQYATPTQERNSIPSNSEGAPGDTVIVNQEGSKSIYVKTQDEWYNTSLQRQFDATNVASSTITAVTETTDTPSVSISSSLIGNKIVQLTFNITNENSFVINRREGNDFNTGSNNTTILTSGTSPFNDTTTANSTQYTYRLTATNGGGSNSVDTTITTLSASTSFNINFIDPQDGSADDAWSDGQLIECAEFDEIDGTSGTSVNALTKYLNNTDFNDGDILYNNSNASTPFDGEAFNTQATGNNFFSMDGTIDKIFQVASNGVLSNVINCAPIAPTITGVVNSSTSITLSIVGDMRVTRHLVVERKTLGGSYSALTSTLAPTSSSSLAHDNITTGYTDTASLSAGTTYVYRVRGKNNTHNGIYSNELQLTTAAAGTSWSNVPADFTITAIGFNGEEVSGAKSITLTNGSGNTTIQCSQSGLTGQLSVAVSTSGDPGISGTSNGATGFATSKTIGVAGTYNLRFKYAKLKNNTENVSCDVTFTNNTVAETGLDITCQGA